MINDVFGAFIEDKVTKKENFRKALMRSYVKVLYSYDKYTIPGVPQLVTRALASFGRMI